MKYVITGSLGHISKPTVKALVSAGNDVTVITSSKDRIKEIESLGAKAAVGSVEDAAFIEKAFAGADVVYTMVPPKWDAADWIAHFDSVGKIYTAAIKKSNVKYVVNLSSVGAHLPAGCGPVSGLHKVENSLNTLTGVHILHLRPSYFYENLLSNIGLIKNAGIMGGNFNIPENKFPIVEPADIAEVAIDALSKLNFSGHSVRYIASDLTGTASIASAIGKAIGKTDLQWVPFSNEQAFEGMTGAGLSAEVARNYVEMGNAMNSGKMFEDYFAQSAPHNGKTKLNDFAKVFATVYNN